MYPHSNGHWRNTQTPVIPGPAADYSRQSRFGKVEPVGVHENIATLVEIMNAAGYATAITQKFHLSPVWKYPFEMRIGVSQVPHSHAQGFRRILAGSGDRPFFAFANVQSTHRPFKPHIVQIDQPPVDPDAIDVPADMPDTPLMRSDLAEYFDTVQCADACAGAILEELRKSGRYDDTLIIFSSDQGFCYQRAKATAYDDAARVPFIVAGRGVSRNVRSKQLVSHIDFMPTVLDYAGLPIPDTVQGRSLRPLLAEAGEEAPWRDVVFYEHNAHGPGEHNYYPIRSAYDGRFHYIRNLLHEKRWIGDPASLLEMVRPPAEVAFAGPDDAFPNGPWGNQAYRATIEARREFPLQYKLLAGMFNRPPEELYDLHSDPFEMVNLAEDPEYAWALKRLRKQTDSWMQETNDPGLALKDTPRRTS